LPEGEVVDLPSLFRAAGPIEIEIGPGRGGFILERSRAEEGVCLLGIEVRRKWATVVDTRLRERGVGERSRVVCDDVRLALPRLGPDGSVARFFVHFPDPWWKKRHQKRLVVVESLVSEIARLLAAGGELFLQTDVPERADEYDRRLGAHPELEPAGDEPRSSRLALNPYEGRSNRERRAELDGLPVYRLRYRRRWLGGISTPPLT
jgi:tRNA (guanine-N7-)-methyltransferase